MRGWVDYGSPGRGRAGGFILSLTLSPLVLLFLCRVAEKNVDVVGSVECSLMISLYNGDAAVRKGFGVRQTDTTGTGIDRHRPKR